MKRNVFLLTLCLLGGVAFGQEVSFRSGEKSGKKLPTQSVLHMLPADADGQLLLVEADLNAVGAVKAIKVRQVNEEWKESAAVKIDDTRDCSSTEAFRKGDRIHMLLGSENKSNYRLRHVVVSTADLQVVSDSVLLDVSLSKGDYCYSQVVFSPSNAFLAVVNILEMKAGGTHATAMLFDGEMRRRWTHMLRHGDVQQALVTDGGEVATACLLSSKDHQKTLLRVNVADASGARQGEAVLQGDLEQVALLNYTGGKMLCTVLEGEGGHGLIGKRRYTAFHSILYDMVTSTLRAGSRHAFTSEELCVFENEDTDTKLSSTSANYILLRHQATTPGGGAVLYQRTWKEATYRNGMEVSATYHRKGMLLASLDTLGNILWTRGVMQNNQNASETKSDMVYQNGSLYIFTNESKDESAEYNPTVAAKRSKSLLMANAALAVYRFAADGTGSKQMLASDGKFIIHSPLFNQGGGKYYLLAGGMGPKISCVTIGK